MKILKIVVLLLIIAGGFYYQAHKRAGKPLDTKEGKQVENIVLNAKIKTAKGDINLKLFPEVASRVGFQRNCSLQAVTLVFLT